MFLTVVIVISGFIGRYIYTRIPRTLDGIEVDSAAGRHSGFRACPIPKTDGALAHHPYPDRDGVFRISLCPHFCGFVLRDLAEMTGKEL